MAYQFPPDVREQMASGEYQSEDDLLRDALMALEDHRWVVGEDDPEVLAGIERGLDQMRRGLGRPFEEFDAELRDKFDLRHDA